MIASTNTYSEEIAFVYEYVYAKPEIQIINVNQQLEE